VKCVDKCVKLYVVESARTCVARKLALHTHSPTYCRESHHDFRFRSA
jgi:hypothetical protein